MSAPVASPDLERLMALPDVYDLTPEKNSLFVGAMREAVRHHRQASAAYAALCEQTGFTEAALEGLIDLARVPHVFVNVLKHHELLSVPRADIALHLTSSGTTGQRSQVFFDAGSLARGLAMVEACFAANGLVNRDQAVNYLVFAHDPAHAPNRGTSYTDHHLTGFTARKALYYALRWDPASADWVFRVEEANAQLEAFAADGAPIRIVGFPAFLHRLIAHRRALGFPGLAFGAGSYVLTGGGWKTAEEEAITKPDFRREVELALGIPEANVRDGYGLVEHGVPYLECAAHRFHVPHYARALVRDVETLEPLGPGETGFLNLLSPYMLSMPAISLLTSDLARWGTDCPCGHATATIEIVGRAGTRKNKGCAIAASQLLR